MTNEPNQETRWKHPHRPGKKEWFLYPYYGVYPASTLTPPPHWHCSQRTASSCLTPSAAPPALIRSLRGGSKPLQHHHRATCITFDQGGTFLLLAFSCHNFSFLWLSLTVSHTWWLNNGRDHLGTGQRRAALFYFHPLKDFTMQCMRMSDIHTQKTETSPLLVFLHACSVVLLTTPARLPPPLSPRLLSSHGRLIRQTFMWKFFKHDSCYF